MRDWGAAGYREKESVRSVFTGVFKNLSHLNFIAACIIKRLWRSGDGVCVSESG